MKLSHHKSSSLTALCALLAFITLILMFTAPARGATAHARAQHRVIKAELTAYTSTWTQAEVAVHWAESQRGKPYCYGGTGLACYDCSGLVMMAYRHAGVYIPRTTYEMQQDYPRIFRVRRPVPGDIILYGWPAYHAALYVGPDREIAATGYGRPIGFMSINWAPHAFYRVRWANTPR